ncbi:MAG: MATE family efflux transporter [Clostridia bacterium]|nr:MATE family efflux transporter [Clostridia bacterium]
MKRSSRYEMDMCQGPILSKVLVFSVPLMLTSVLQLLFNAADIVVVGRFAGPTALAAVGSTGALINLIVNVLMGMSIGTSVLVARYYGADSPQDVSETVHTSIAISFFGGIAFGVAGIFLCRPLLALMGTPDDVIDQAALYMRIYFMGLPVIAVYNFGSAVLRAVGDTKRPMYFLTLAGVVNVLFNLLCVIVLKMGVAGVAVPTVLSQAVAASLVIWCLRRSDTSIHLDLRKVRVHVGKLREIVKIGLPAGIQGSVFSLSNVVIQSSVNSFGSTVMAANSSAANLEGFVYVIMNAFYQAALTFTSQNLGARQYARIRRILFSCVGLVSVFGLFFGIGGYTFGETLLTIYSTDPSVIHWGMIRLSLVCAPYFLCGIMDTMVGMMRGLGYSIAPMFVSMVGVVGVRLGWIFTVFAAAAATQPAESALASLYWSYPVSWGVTAAVHLGCFIYAYHKLMKNRNTQPMAAG